MTKKYLRHFLWPLAHVRHPMYEERFTAQLKNTEERNATPMELLRGTSDDYFFWLMAFSHELGIRANDLVPTVAPPRVQRDWTGMTGESVMKQAFLFYRQTAGWARLHGEKPIGQMEVLDFGCGWGRIIRFFMRDVPHAKLHGRDCWDEATKICRETNKWCDFKTCSILPPLDFADASLDLVYLFSVFSHLNEAAHTAWLREFHRVLKPGGLLVVTTRPRAYLKDLSKNRRRLTSKGLFQSMHATTAFPDIDEALRRYDQGDYCFSPTGGGGGPLDATWYGETCIPEKYVRTQWHEFHFLDSRKADRRINQSVYCVRKPPT